MYTIHRVSRTIFLLFTTVVSSAQTVDSSTQLPEIIINAFEQNRKLKDVGAAVHFISARTLERFNAASIVHAVNTTPGVRMEERSPGSYRFNIRGSSLRSPFGVRNVKVYFNDIPITDPGGHTYLNQLGYYNFGSLEIIKGPGNSLYGSGTGGVLLINSVKQNEEPGVFFEYTTRSYNQQNIYGRLTTASQNIQSSVGFQHQQSDGYRQHSKMRRDVFSWNTQINLGPSAQLKTSFLYADLFYQTPGALTRTEFAANPKASRPGNTNFPGATAAQAAIYQKQLIAGAVLTQTFTKSLQNKTVLYGMFTELRNPNIQNYSRNTEPHGGLRSTFQLKKQLANASINFQIGGEVQTGFASITIHKNVAGNADSLRSADDIRNLQSLAFLQAGFENSNWIITTGASINFLNVRLQRFTPATTGTQQRNFTNGFTPRVSVLKKLNAVNLYAVVSKGFSPPTTSELLPTGGAINLALNAEQGWNYEIGFKGSVLKNLFVDVNAFRFSLSNTIVQRRNAGGGDFYINAGSTLQYGVETYLSYPFKTSATTISNGLFWMSHTWHHFRYKNFTQLTNNFSGNKMPATAPHTISTGIDFNIKKAWLVTATHYYSGKVALNDANTDFANSYHLLGLKLGYQKLFSSIKLKISAGAENLLNETYSLGNDVNGFGGRYFNAAASRNFFVSIGVGWKK